MRKNPRLAPHAWIYAIPVLGILWVLFSSLSFVPVPWPDDSAFFFPAKDLFSWPPRWVMIPQAPFEPTYREWNFNTMPLFPILIGVFRLVGVAGNHALKILPLGGWLLGILFALHSFRRAGASRYFLVAAALVLTFDPILRWSSVLIRPESLIGAMGIFILLGARFGWPALLRERRFFHPVSLALLVSALLHFNAIHLVPVVLILYAREPRKILKIGTLTAVGLVPWFLTILMKPGLFAEQMALQFGRLTGFHNPWLSSWESFTGALLQDMGSPEAWAVEYRWATLGALFLIPPLLVSTAILSRRTTGVARDTLLASLGWLVSAVILWHTKAEVWFTHYFHLAFWIWALLVAFELRSVWATVFPAAIGFVFLYGQIGQTLRLESTETWHWRVYDEWVDCIDHYLTEEFERRGRPEVFRVWDPTFPDVTIALSNRHPRWEFTRTNDFYDRANLAIRHGHEVEAVVVPETYRGDEQKFSGPLHERPDVRSVWMNWKDYFLYALESDPKFKPRRFLCQNGRWDAFIYFEN